MLIGLVRESVMQCFCHTCRAPLPSAVHRSQMPITKLKAKSKNFIEDQPRRVQFITTEVRCQEKTRGGLRYEVILAEPDVKVPPPKLSLSPRSSVSVQDIEDKLKAAEERRQQLESNKMAAWSAKILKIEEAGRKKNEMTTEFISTTRSALEQKMGTHEEKREAYITDLRSKLKDHIENVEKTRLSLEQQTDEVRSAIEDKLKTASQQRDENIKKMLDRLKEHEEQVSKVREQNSVKLQHLEAAIQEKLVLAQTRKEQLEQEQKEKLKVYEEQVTKIREQNTVKLQQLENAIQEKLVLAQTRKEQIEQEMKEKIKVYEKRAEVVRQNKANLTAEGKLSD